MAKTLLGTVLNRTPVDLTGNRGRSFIGSYLSEPDTQSLKMMEAVSTLFGIVDGIATGVAAANWNLYQGEGPTLEDDPDAEIVTTPHPAKTLWNKPNPHYTRAEYVEAMQQHYELTGEYWWVLSQMGMMGGRQIRAQFPLEMWIVRPDRIRPVPHPSEFLSGFMYRASGDDVALSLDQVIFSKRQNPMDPYRGLSPIGSLIYELHGTREAARYNMAFFRNGAMPGGVITETGDLSDPEFEQLMERWNQQHKGAKNAHRVGMLEKGKFVPVNYTRKDMEFVDLQKFNKETIREAYRFPISKLGSETASNRATHEAENLTFAEDLILPRLRRLRGSLNDDLLPKFGSLGQGYFFDFVDPSPEDSESMRQDQTAAVDAVVALVEIGADPETTVEAFGLPEIVFDSDRLPQSKNPPQAPPPSSPQEPVGSEGDDDEDEDEDENADG